MHVEVQGRALGNEPKNGEVLVDAAGKSALQEGEPGSTSQVLEKVSCRYYEGRLVGCTQGG